MGEIEATVDDLAAHNQLQRKTVLCHDLTHLCVTSHFELSFHHDLRFHYEQEVGKQRPEEEGCKDCSLEEFFDDFHN